MLIVHKGKNVDIDGNIFCIEPIIFSITEDVFILQLLGGNLSYQVTSVTCWLHFSS